MTSERDPQSICLHKTVTERGEGEKKGDRVSWKLRTISGHGELLGSVLFVLESRGDIILALESKWTFKDKTVFLHSQQICSNRKTRASNLWFLNLSTSMAEPTESWDCPDRECQGQPLSYPRPLSDADSCYYYVSPALRAEQLRVMWKGHRTLRCGTSPKACSAFNGPWY